VLDKHPQDIKLVHKNFPLAKHKFAKEAAAAALSANMQGKFSEFHKKLFEIHKNLDGAKIQEIAQALRLDMEKFNRDMKNPTIQSLIIRDVRDGQRAGVRGIPAVFINGKQVRDRSLRGLEAMIEAELKKKK
jgi:protein-disulfide isomerase